MVCRRLAKLSSCALGVRLLLRLLALEPESCASGRASLHAALFVSCQFCDKFTRRFGIAARVLASSKDLREKRRPSERGTLVGRNEGEVLTCWDKVAGIKSCPLG